MVKEFLELLNEIHDHAPPWFWPLFLATVISWGLTQRVKFYLPLHWNSTLRALIAQGVAFWSGFVVVVVLWPDKYGVLCGITIGIWSPAAYAFAVRKLLPRGARDWLSADTRE